MLKVDKLMAKYFRALPLHHTQMEEVHDDYSIFTYNMLISSFELRNKILSYGPQVEVMQPPALRARIITDLEDAIKNYK